MECVSMSAAHSPLDVQLVQSFALGSVYTCKFVPLDINIDTV